MTVASTPGSNGKCVIKVPVELLAPSTAGLGSPREMAFTVVTAKPGATGETQVCDVSTMGAVSAEDGLISGSHQVKLAELDGGSSSIASC